MIFVSVQVICNILESKAERLKTHYQVYNGSPEVTVLISVDTNRYPGINQNFRAFTFEDIVTLSCTGTKQKNVTSSQKLLIHDIRLCVICTLKSRLPGRTEECRKHWERYRHCWGTRSRNKRQRVQWPRSYAHCQAA